MQATKSSISVEELASLQIKRVALVHREDEGRVKG